MSTLAVVERILRDTKAPMSVREIVERAGESLPTKSKTPDTVVARDLSMDIKKRGETSPFIRTSPGRYTMREFVVAHPQHTADVPVQPAVEATEIGVASMPSTTESTPMMSQALGSEHAPTKPATDVHRRPDTSEDSVTA